MPTTTTNTTTDTLIPVITAENLDDSLVPSAIRVATPPTITSAPQSSWAAPNLTVPPENPNTVPR